LPTEHRLPTAQATRRHVTLHGLRRHRDPTAAPIVQRFVPMHGGLYVRYDGRRNDRLHQVLHAVGLYDLRSGRDLRRNELRRLPLSGSFSLRAYLRPYT
jgi:hypothetical protein